MKKEELPVLYENCFQIPIHPKLLRADIQIDKTTAHKMFPQAAEEWYNDLKEYSKTADKSTKEWLERVFLKEKPKIIERYGGQLIEELNWEDRVFTLDNGLAHSFMINRNFGGSLYCNNDHSCEAFINFNDESGYIRFSEEKGRAFSYKILDGAKGEFGIAKAYGLHNVDNYPGALFLRNWAILYMNEAFKQVFK